MFTLFITELKRHRALTAGAAALHLAMLYYVYTLGRSVLTIPGVVLWLLSCIGVSAGFGVFQMALYKRDNDWVHLLHRPLRPQQIFLALLLAGWCLLLAALVLPLGAITLIMDGNALYGIEWRHYQMVPYASATAMIAYCCGCFAILSPSRLGLLAISMATPMAIINMGSAIWIKALVLLVWSFALAQSAFKPDLQQAPRKVRTLLMTELPIQYGCLWLIVLATTLMLALDNYMSGSDPSRNPPAGTENFVWLMPAKEVMQLALDNSSHEDSAFLRQQVLLGETLYVEPPDNYSYPQRNQMPRLDTALQLSDAEKNIVWQFSHGNMLFEGRDGNSRALVGYAGPDGFHPPSALPPSRFSSVPWTSANQYIISDDDIYRVNWDDGELHHRYHKDSDDRFANALTLSEHVAAQLSDKALYFFSSAELANTEIALHPKAVLQLPPNENTGLRRIFVLPLVDGYLVSVFSDHMPFDMATDLALINNARLELYWLRGGAEPELISRMALPSSLEGWFIYKELVLAPGMRLLTDLAWGLHDHRGPRYTLPLLYVDFERNILLITALVCLFSAGLTATLLRRSRVPLGIRLFWIVGNGITGFAGLLSFFFGYYWRRDQLMITYVPHVDSAKQE